MQLHTGTGSPALNLGSIGDLYLDTDAEAVYCKMDYSTWRNIPNSGADTTARDAAEAAQETADLAQPAAFTPADAGDWSPAPTTIEGAIDQLAARVQAIEDA